MKKELMALSALSLLFADSCSYKQNELTQEDQKKVGDLMFVDLPDKEDDKAYFYINTDQNEITPEYTGYKYVDDRPDCGERIMPRELRMPLSKWREQLLDFQAVDSKTRVKE